MCHTAFLPSLKLGKEAKCAPLWNLKGKIYTFLLNKKCNSGKILPEEGEQNMTLREIRQQAHLTQAQAAEKLGVSLRSYKSYETDISKADTLKYQYMTERLSRETLVDESHGLLSIKDIKAVCNEVFSQYPVTWCYLFGSYAKGTATEQSDVDLAVSEGVEGLRFYGMVEALRNSLRKNVDVLTIEQLSGNPKLLNEIMQDGIKIYEQH